MKYAAIVLSCLLFAGPVSAVAQTADQSAQGAGISRKTQDFVTQVAVSDLFEFASAKLAQAHGNEAEKQFANQMTEDHMKAASEFKRIVLNALPKAEIPSELDIAHQRKLDELNNSRGADFQSIYAAQQLQAHKEAVSGVEQFANSGDQPDLRAWAETTLPVLRHHLEMAQQLSDQRAPTVGSATSK